jgi:hypothetical protein
MNVCEVGREKVGDREDREREGGGGLSDLERDAGR